MEGNEGRGNMVGSGEMGWGEMTRSAEKLLHEASWSQ
jgi:hypothetical protein